MPKEPDKDIIPIEKAQQYAKDFTVYSRKYVMSEGAKELSEYRAGKKDKLTRFTEMVSLFEFDNAHLLTGSVGKGFQALAKDLTDRFQAEYKCATAVEKSIAHIAALNFVRVLQIQQQYNNAISADTYNQLSLRRTEFLGKEYERAYRQYHSSIQALRSLRQPPIKLTIKTENANIAQQQIVQVKPEVKSI